MHAFAESLENCEYCGHWLTRVIDGKAKGSLVSDHKLHDELPPPVLCSIGPLLLRCSFEPTFWPWAWHIYTSNQT